MRNFTKVNNKETVMRGVILSIDLGYGMKYEDEDGLYLKMVIQMYDGYECVQLFTMDKIPVLLKEFQSEYSNEVSIKGLIHQNVYLLTSDSTNTVPNAIAKLPPSEFDKFSWVYNDNWG